MGYRSKKRTQEKTVKWLRLTTVVGLCILFAALCVFSAFVPIESWKYYFDLPSLSKRADGELRIHYLDVENGGCALVELPDGKNVIVGGGADDGAARKNAFRFLNALKIKTVDAVIVPNTSRNGVGILRELVSYYEVKSAYVATTNGENAEFSAFLTDLERKEIPVYEACKSELFGESGEYDLRFLLPLTADESNPPVLSLSYCGVDVLLGDGYGKDVFETLLLEKQLGLWEKWGVDLQKFDLIQAPVNIAVDDLTAFADGFGVNSVIFSCRGGDGYSPAEEALDALKALDKRVYRTDRHGYITVSIDASGYGVTTEKE